MQDKKSFWKGALSGVLATSLVLGGGFYAVTSMGPGNVINEEGVTSREHLEKLNYMEALIDNSYLGEADTEDMTQMMYKGMVAGLEDPYSRYYTEEEYESLQETTNGSYEGIGVVMQQTKDGLARVVRCYEGAPGTVAGMLPGDYIYKVNGEDVTGLELTEIVKRIKDPEINPVTVTVAREGETDYLDFEITKEEVKIPVVSHKMLEENIGYIAMYEFTDNTFEQYQTAFEDLKSQNMQRLIIDLRGNPGGLYKSVCSILNTILPKGVMVYTEDKYGNREEQKSEGKTPLDMPLVVLVNESSASASEIFAGAVKDYEIGTIVGTTTFGKGVVQTLRPLADGSAVKLTISNYFTPKGININGEGIKPDVEIELDEELRQQAVITEEEDNQLQKAIEVVKQME